MFGMCCYGFLVVYEKNSFAKISKGLAGYRSENNFVWTIKIIMKNA